MPQGDLDIQQNKYEVRENTSSLFCKADNHESLIELVESD